MQCLTGVEWSPNDAILETWPYGINQYLWFINKLSYDFIYFVTELDIDKFYCLATAMKIPDMRVEESNGVPTSEFLCPAEPKVFYSVKI